MSSMEHKAPHFMFQGKPHIPQQLIIHQVYWSATPCTCLSPQTVDSLGGVWSIVSPVRHHADMFASALACRHCDSEIEVTTRIEYVPVTDDDQVLAALPVESPLQ